METPKKKKVMICDDDFDILEVTALILLQKGYEVDTYSDCNNIFAKVEVSKPDVILMDLWIPDLGGENVTALLKASEKTRSIPVILFSANNDIEKVALSAGAEGFIRKPFEIRLLEEMISARILAAETSVGQQKVTA